MFLKTKYDDINLGIRLFKDLKNSLKRHVRCLICEVFKSLNNLNPEFMWPYFVFKNI